MTRRALAALLAAAALAPSAHAAGEGDAGFRCGMEPGLFPAPESGLLSLPCAPDAPLDPLRPSTKALLVFVQYVNESPHAASPCWTGWPKDQAPRWADSLLVPATDPALFPPGSLNHYFHTLSGGRHFVYGNPLHQIITLDYWLGWYRDNATLAELCEEILAKVDPLVNFADYDVAPQDGVVDMVFILFRTDMPYGWQGASYFGKSTVPTNDLQGGMPVTLNGCYPGSGTVQFAPNHIGALQTIAHEYMHQVFVPSPHVSGNPNAFPTDSFHLDWLSSYGLMDGNGQGTVMSAFERAWIGWAEPQAIGASVTGVRFTDAATTGFMAKVLLDPDEPDEYFLLENRQRVSFYEGTHGDGTGAECCNNELESTGLLVYHVDLRDLPGEFPDYRRKTVDIEAADGMYDPASGAPDAVAGRDDLDDRSSPGCAADTVGTDAFTPVIFRSFTPVTNPNTNGYAFAEPFGPWKQTRPTGVSVQNVRYDPADPTLKTLLADFLLPAP